jgi:hypothetical protein
VEAGAVYDDIVLLLKTPTRFVKSYITWLQANGINLIP